MLDAGRVWCVKLAGNAATGYRVFILLQHDALDQIRQVSLQGGIYVMNEDGSNLKQLASREQLAAMLGVQDPLNFVCGVTGPSKGNMDVSEDGSAVVFATSGGAHVFGVNDDGTGLHIIQRAQRFGSLCISRDGRLVGFAQSRGLTQVNGVMSFDGGPIQDLYEGGSYTELRFTADGGWLQCGDTGILAATGGQAHRQVSAHSGGYTTDPPLLITGGLWNASMDAQGDRFVYLWTDPNGVQQLATLERTDVLNGAPGIANPVVDPNFVIRPAESYSKVIADVAFAGSIVRVSHVAMLAGGEQSGLVDTGVDRAVMLDNGQTGDGAAGDGRFASAYFAARDPAQLGLHAMRVNAEGDDAAGLRHATSLEFVPFSVVASGAPRIDSITPNEGEGGIFATIKGEFFDPDGWNTVRFGGEIASVHSSTQQEIVAAVPYGIPPGPVFVTVTARELTSNAVLFNMQGEVPCAYTVDPLNLNVAVGGTTGSISVSTSAECQWSAQSNAGWIGVLSGASGTGSGTVQYSVAANPASQSRTGTLTVAGKPVTVSQAGGGECAYELSEDSQFVAAAGGLGSVIVLTQTGCAWNAVSSAPWVELVGGISGNGDGLLTYLIQANTGPAARSGTITIAGQTVDITQAGADEIPLEVEIYVAVEVRWKSELGRMYQVLRAFEATPDEYTPVGDPLPGTGDFISVFETTRDKPKAFYKVEILQ